MEKIRLSEAMKATGGRLIGQDMDISTVVTDSRKASSGNLFVALKGERFDAHDFIPGLFEKGNIAAISQKEVSVPDGCALILVEDTLLALGALAFYYRKRFNIPVIGVTGSVGKTTTKEFIYSVLSIKYKTLKTEGNFNNEVGLPLTVLNMDSSYNAAVIEMGMSDFGEIKRLSNIALPECAVITNIGVAHIEKLHSREGILKAKLEILEGLKKDGFAVFNGDEPLLWSLKNKIDIPVYYFGLENKDCDFLAMNIKESGGKTLFDVSGKINFEAEINVTGRHNVMNALCACAVGFMFNMDAESIKKGLYNFKNAAMRQDVFVKSGVTFIDDTYNANPDSMKAAINVLKTVNGEGRKIAVLSDMLELGGYSKTGHTDIGQYCSQMKIDILFCTGVEAVYYAKSARMSGMEKSKVFYFEDRDKMCIEIINILKTGDTVLFKGSRGMKMENVMDSVVKGWGNDE